MKIKTKIYCGVCVYFSHDDDVGIEICGHPDNITDNYRSPFTKNGRPPAIINKRNNCKWFKRVPGLFFHEEYGGRLTRDNYKELTANEK